MKMEEKTIKQRKKTYRRAQIAAHIGEYAVVPIPFAIMAIVNRNEWFPTAEAGMKVGIGGGLAIGLMMLAIFLITKKQENEKMTDGYITLMLGWALGAVIMTLIRDIADQIANIMWFGLTGIAAGFGLDIARKSAKKKADLEDTALKNAEAKLKEEQATQELISEQEKKVKVKVVKK